MIFESTQQLLEACVEPGSSYHHVAWETFYKRYTPYLQRIAVANIGSLNRTELATTVVEDIVQNVYASIVANEFRNIKSLLKHWSNERISPSKQETRFDAWLAKVAHRQAAIAKRRWSRWAKRTYSLPGAIFDESSQHIALFVNQYKTLDLRAKAALLLLLAGVSESERMRFLKTESVENLRVLEASTRLLLDAWFKVGPRDLELKRNRKRIETRLRTLISTFEEQDMEISQVGSAIRLLRNWVQLADFVDAMNSVKRKALTMHGEAEKLSKELASLTKTMRG